MVRLARHVLIHKRLAVLIRGQLPRHCQAAAALCAPGKIVSVQGDAGGGGSGSGSGGGGAGGGGISVTLLYSRFDGPALERVAGSQRAARMLAPAAPGERRLGASVFV